MFDDFKDLLSAFNAANVRYLIVGGYAVSLHAQPRATKDLDILISTDADNSKAVYIALTIFGAPVEGLSPTDFTEPDNFFRMGTPPVLDSAACAGEHCPGALDGSLRNRP